jgi:hypothetical protein
MPASAGMTTFLHRVVFGCRFLPQPRFALLLSSARILLLLHLPRLCSASSVLFFVIFVSSW